MLTPTFRFVALPLAAVLTLAALSMQPAASKSTREIAVSAKAADCAALKAGDFCVVDPAGS